jgi:hypothetical protein
VHQTKLIQLLKSFSDKEISSFNNFLESPYFNRSAKLCMFYGLLKSHHPKFESPALGKEKLYVKLYGPGKYNDLAMRKLISELFQLANDFIAYEEFKNGPFHTTRQRHAWLTKRGLEKLREQAVEYSEKLFAQHPVRDSHFYLHRWLADFDKFEYEADRYKDAEHKLAEKVDLQGHLRSLDRYYLLKYFETQLYTLSVSKLFKEPYHGANFEHAESLAQKYIGQGDLVIDLYYYLVQLEKSDAIEYYQMLKTKLLAGDPAVPEDLSIEIAISLENFVAKQVRGGHSQLVNDLMEIYRFRVKHNLMFYKGEIRYFFYHNVVMAGLRIGDFDFVTQFLEDYKSKITEPYREDLYLYCKAHLYFRTGQFNEALQLALRVNPIMYNNKADLKALIAMLHFELGMFVQLETTLESFPYYLADQTLLENSKERYANFVKSIRKMATLKQNYSRIEFLKLWHQFRHTGLLDAKTWFNDKMKEIANLNGMEAKEME